MCVIGQLEVFQTDRARIMYDQKEHATLRARCRWVPHERMVVDALTKRQWEQHYDAATVAGWSVDEDQKLAMRKTYREKHKRNLRPHRHVEQAQTVEWDETQWVGLTRSKADEIACSDS